jgi:hypothetical protein
MKTKADLIKEFNDLNNNGQTGKNRGFSFERLINESLNHEKLSPSFSYKPTGEQIDGMFEFKNRFFHVECKWESDPICASKIYSLQGKLKGKLIGSHGVFISMSDYSEVAPEALEKGKEIDILLFTRNDVAACFTNSCSFSELLEIKLRYAALYGSVLYEYSTHLQLLKLKKVK